ncbi:MAG: hypothetical protein ABI895_25045 [Deltaproteobacteria bacterium]
MNLKWHERHVLPKRASLQQRIEWHQEHQAECACRPIPARLLEQMQPSSAQTTSSPTPAKRAPRPSAADQHSSVADTKFSNIVLAFGDQRSVTYGGKGFGSSALKLSGKIFAMLTSNGQFVVKLTRERVAELVEQNRGQYYDPGHGRLMLEWLVVPSSSRRWLELAKEAHTAASGRPSRISRPPFHPPSGLPAARSGASRSSNLRAGRARTTKESKPRARSS